LVHVGDADGPTELGTADAGGALGVAAGAASHAARNAIAIRTTAAREGRTLT